ncbi:hypothetical protein RI129_012396 [Pyrocoelia pectoralis]|uniref:DUF4200 domain-containing protein n=1 Tax=Pyrocoelia pectoralis TaxID=417401 RepID=A0AAN7V3Q2_9COLE
MKLLTTRPFSLINTKMYYPEIDNEITFPQISPEKTIGDFIESKLNDRILKKYPEWDFPRVEPKINLTALRRDLHDVEGRLAKKREEVKLSKVQLDDEWKNLEEEGLKLRKTFCEFDKMIKENAAKTERATAKTKNLIIRRANIDHSIELHENDRAKLLKVVAETNSDEFTCAQDVFNKFATLDEARNDVTGRLMHNINVLEDTKDQMQQLINQNTTLIGLNNQIATLNNRFQEAKTKCEKWDGIVHNAQISLRDRLLDIVSVRKVCRSIYLDICKRRTVEPRIKENDLEGQLWYIKKYLPLLRKTIDIAEKMAASDGSTQVVKPRSRKHHK